MKEKKEKMKKKMKKKVVSLLLMLAMVFSMMPMTALADGGEETVPPEYQLSVLAFRPANNVGFDTLPMSPAFDPTVKNYTVYAPDCISSSFTCFCTRAATATGTINVKYGGTSKKCSNGKGVALGGCLNPGAVGNTVTISVNGVDAYEVNVVRFASISSLSVSKDDETMTMTPAFHYNTRNYMITSDCKEALKVKAVMASAGSTMTVNGVAAEADEETNTFVASVVPEWSTDGTATLSVAASNPDMEPQTYTVTLVKPMKELRITKAPDKVSYTDGETLDLTGMVVSAVYSEDEIIPLSPESYTVSHSGPVGLGMNAITVSYRGYTAQQPITVGNATVPKNLQVFTDLLIRGNTTAGTDKIGAECTYTPSFDPVVKAYMVYVDEMETGIQLYPSFNLDAIEGHDITVEYVKAGNTIAASQTIDKNSERIAISSLLIQNSPQGTRVVIKVDGTEAYSLNIVRSAWISALTVKNGTVDELTPKFNNAVKCYDYEVLVPSAEKDTAKYVLNADPMRIGSTLALNGEAIDSCSDVVINPVWGADRTYTSTLTVSDDCPVDGVVKIRFLEKPESFTLKSAPNKTVYSAGENFDPTGMEVVATYADGKEVTVAPEDLIFSHTVLPDGIENVTVSYRGYNVSIPVTCSSSHSLSGSGTAEDPFLIATADDYVAVQNMVKAGTTFQGKYLKQTADITLPEGWEPIGNKIDKTIVSIQAGANVNHFMGTLDGDNHLITVPDHGMPLFGYVREATIKNLNIYGEHIDGYGLVNNMEGVNLSGTAVTIDNCTIKAGTNVLKSGFTGGVVTENSYAGVTNSYFTYIRNCTVEEGVTIGYDGTQKQIGSFAGRLQGVVENCKSYATVKGSSMVGGIVGGKDNAMNTSEVSKCEFHGTVIASDMYAGGITGGCYNNETAPNGGFVLVHDCVVDGKITGADRVGGILGGDPYLIQSWGAPNTQWSNNNFSGKVEATKGSCVGAIVGYLASLNAGSGFANNFYTPNCGADKGVGFVVSVDTSCEKYAGKDGQPYGWDKETGTYYYNSATDTISIVDKAILSYLGYNTDYVAVKETNHNRTDDPLGADSENLWKCGIPGEAYVTGIELSGDYKTEYRIGDELDTEGMVVKLRWSDNTTTEADPADLTFTGFDSSERGQMDVTVKYDKFAESFSVTVLKPAGDDITVKISIYGDDVHTGTSDVHTYADGNLTAWVKETSYTVNLNATVKDVLEKVLADNNMTCSNPKGNYVESITRNGVELAEFTNGQNSGWMYVLNGKYPDFSVNEQYLNDGDVIVFHYTDDYTRESTGYEGGESNTELMPVNKLSDAEVQKLYDNATSFLEGLGTPYTGSVGGEWMVLGLYRNDKTVASSYLDGVKKYVVENINEKEQLHRNKSTDNARIIIALSAMGYDVTNVKGHNLLAGLSDMNFVKKQGLNGPIWALIAFDTHNYEIPEGDVTREGLIQAILDAQLADGGWAISGSKSDVDMTGMALTALAKYYNKNSKVKTAVDKAVGWLSSAQNADGGFSTITGTNTTAPTSESTSQAIVALSALGIDAKTDARFVKNGVSAIDALCTYADLTNGGFKHLYSQSKFDGMATEQAYYALTAYNRFKVGKTSLYDMSDVSMIKIEETQAVKDVEKQIEAVASKVDDINVSTSTETAKTEYVASVVDAVKAYEALSFGEKEAISDEVLEQIETAKEKAGEINHKDGDVVVDGVEWNIKVDASVAEATSAEAKTIEESVGKKLEDGTALVVYDITLTDVMTGTKVEPGEDGIKITLPVPESAKGFDHIIVAHLRDDGVIEYVIPEVNGNMMTFKLSSLSPVSIVGYNGEAVQNGFTDDTTSSPNTGDNSTSVYVYALLMMLCAGAFVTIRRKER